MRIALVTLLCTLVLTASGGTGARADDKADVEKEFKKFQGTWTFESVKTGGKGARRPVPHTSRLPGCNQAQMPQPKRQRPGPPAIAGSAPGRTSGQFQGMVMSSPRSPPVPVPDR